MLVYFYVFALVVGGVLLASSFLLGGSGRDVGAGPPDTGPSDAGREAERSRSAWPQIVRSAPFWAFFLAFFGLAGLALTGLGLMQGDLRIAGVAGAVGVAGALGAARLH